MPTYSIAMAPQAARAVPCESLGIAIEAPKVGEILEELLRRLPCEIKNCSENRQHMQDHHQIVHSWRKSTHCLQVTQMVYAHEVPNILEKV